MKPLDLLEMIAGAYGTRILLQLSRSPLAADLAQFQKPGALARRHRLEPEGLRHLLKFLAQTTVVLEAKAGAYRWRQPASLSTMRFQLEKFIAAYGGAVSECLEAIRLRHSGRSFVDGRALAAAFHVMGENVNQEVFRAIVRAQVNCLLDLGCGTGALLRALAQGDPRFTGIGVDANSAMCRAARRAARAAGLGDRIRTVTGRAPADLRKLPRKERARIDSLHGASFLNEFFHRGPERAVRVLKELGRLFPGRRAWFVDYHGWLGTRKRTAPPLVNLLQDVAQTVSGQGVPPGSNAAWEQVYRAASCEVITLRTHHADAVEWCLHAVRLPAC